jgi:serine/threonine protein kinase
VVEIGRGAMGEVYKARDPLIGRLVALKVITSGLVGRPELLERFYQEARSAGALQHPNIVTVYELGKEGDLPFIAMEFLGGESIEKMIARQEPLPLSKKVGYIIQICRALEYAHKHGVVHRDIKPGNIMLNVEGSVKVVDFGIARLVDASKTQTGTLIGTLGYMSPQQLRGEHADERSDIWAVGVLFYEMLAYQRPFTGDNPAALMMSIISKEPAPLQGAVAECTAEVEAIVFRMLQKEAINRYQSMEEALLDLDPVWKRLQQARVDDLVSASQRAVEAKDLKQAQQLLREALRVDSSRQEAKSLLETVSRELRRQEVLPRVQQQVSKAREMFQAGQWQQAKAEAQSALQLDSTCAPARELIAEAEKALERAREIERKLRVSKQRLATGSITEADQQLDEILSLDPHNQQAQELRKQIHEEISRRERRKHFTESVHQARELWSQLRYADCIALLTELQKEFPADTEVSKLLETARRDQAEQQKQGHLTEARNLLAAGRHEDARANLNALLAQFPGDTAVQNLLNLVVDEQKAQARQQRLQTELSALRGLIAEGKHAEAVKRGEQLLSEFSGEFELAEVVNFARAELRRADQARSLEDNIAKVRSLIAKGSYEEAVRLADQTLADSPRNADLLSLRENALAKQKEKERRENLDKRIREVKARINRDELTGAIEMAKETIATLGADTDVSQLLEAAEVERTLREKKKQQDEKFEAAQTLVQAGQTDEATQILSQAIETQLIDASDPRVQAVLGEVEKKKKEKETLAPPPPPAEPAAPTMLSSWPGTNVGEPAKDYVFQAPPAQDSAPAAPADTAPQEGPQATAFSATSFSDAAVQPGQSQPGTMPPPPPPAEVRAPAKPAKKAPKRAEPPAAPPAVRQAQPAAAAPAKKPFPVAIAAIAALVVVGAGLYFAFGMHRGAAPSQNANAPVASQPPATAQPKPAPVTPPVNPLEQQQRQLMDQAQQLLAQGQFDQALQKTNQALKLNGPLQQDVQTLQNRIQSAANDKAAQAALQKESQLWTDGVAAFRKDNFSAAERDFRQITALNGGVHKADAQNYLKTLIPQAKASRRQIQSLVSRYRSSTNNAGALRSLQSQFQKLEGVGGSVGQEARDYAENRIPAALDRIAAREAANNKPAPPSNPAPVAQPPVHESAPPPAGATQRFLWVVTANTASARSTWNGSIKKGQMVGEAYVDGGLKLLSHPLSLELVRRAAAGGGSHYTLDLDVDTQGHVSGGKLLSGKGDVGNDLLKEAEMNWQFSAPKVKGTPVRTTISVDLQF